MSKINQRQNFSTQLIKMHKDQYQQLFESAPVALVEGIWKKTFTVITANPSALALFSAETMVQFSEGFQHSLSRIPRKVLLEMLSARLKGDLFESEFRLPTLKRNFVHVFMRLAHMPHNQDGEQHVILAFYDITSRIRNESMLKKLSQIDGLTKLLNQRTIMQRFDEELSRAQRYKLNLSCIILDLDNFKKVNDTFGHLSGDKCIKNAAEMLKNSLRKTDIVGRYGGDEFLVILPEVRSEQAVVPVERFMKGYELKSEIKRKNDILKTTFSVGISCYPTEGIESVKDLIKSADHALYKSKLAGGNCYNIFTKQT